MENFKNHVRSLIQLALADQKFDQEEKVLIYNLGKAHSVSETDIDELIKEELQNKEFKTLTFSALSYDEKFEYLYNIIQLMKVDNKVFLTEIKFCEEMAKSIGFKEKVVGRMSRNIYSDPSITTDIEALKRAVKRYEL